MPPLMHHGRQEHDPGALRCTIPALPPPPALLLHKLAGYEPMRQVVYLHSSTIFEVPISFLTRPEVGVLQAILIQ